MGWPPAPAHHFRQHEPLAAGRDFHDARRCRFLRLQRRFDGNAIRMRRRQQIGHRAPLGAERARHRRVREQQVAVGADERDGILEALADRLDRALLGELGPIGRQPRRDRLERLAEIAQRRVRRQIHLDVELAASEAGEAAADHVDRPDDDLRHQHRQEHRHGDDSGGREQGLLERLLEIPLQEQRRHRQVNRADVGAVEDERRAHGVVAAELGANRLDLRDRPFLEQALERRQVRRHQRDADALCDRRRAMVTPRASTIDT